MLPKKSVFWVSSSFFSIFVLSLASDLGSPQFGPQLHLHHHHLLLRLHPHHHLKHLELHLHVTLPTPTTCTSLNHCTGSVEHSQHNRRCFHWLPSWITSAWNELIVKPKLVTVDKVTSYWESSKFIFRKRFLTVCPIEVCGPLSGHPCHPNSLCFRFYRCWKLEHQGSTSKRTINFHF